ncbi:EAL domain-containing protein [Thiobaca trueperi]|uniref:EAL domain-containing protein (Putative c-di-GMP-specific phosphodiesterase class I) n=1 Tax=Thiobaca trueperi TaxID=127458 RepID=A0A4R3NAF6_9GAMM|nr:EAL domain-containing protein [Thiobaca trueperi]TCT24143.1 EAL domain-containing protein (putative c-di-GMP-specific phosphodiesterase class I) [Thiobaca trueperi]
MAFNEILAYFEEWSGDRSGTAHHLRFDDQGAFGSYRGMRLYSAFQPLFAGQDLAVVAHEALLRVRDEDGRALSPAEAFAVPTTPSEAMYFDRLCRMVHTLNFVQQAESEAELFLNVSGRHLLSLSSGHGQTFEHLLNLCGLTPDQIILEILEGHVDDIGRLNDAVNAYRSRGYRVAIDDFGCEDSNFDRLWKLTPDIVKLDRSLIVQGTTNERARRILPKLVEIIHELGAQVVCEGIENLDQHSLAVDAGSDLVQGYYYARPSSDLIAPLTQTDARLFHPINSLNRPRQIPLLVQTGSTSTQVVCS